MTRTQSHLNEKMMVSDKKVKWKWRQPGPGCDTNPTFEWLCSSKYFFVKVECRCWQFVFFFWYNPMIQRRTFPCSSCSSLLLWDHNENFTFGIDPNSNSTKQLNFSPCSVIPACIRIPCSSRNSLLWDHNEFAICQVLQMGGQGWVVDAEFILCIIILVLRVLNLALWAASGYLCIHSGDNCTNIDEIKSATPRWLF